MLKYRFANKDDAMLYFNWTNDSSSRENSFNKNEISLQDHLKWFDKQLNSGLCFFYLFINENNIPVGQVRIEKNEFGNPGEALLSLSVDIAFRGKGYGSQLIRIATDDFLIKHEKNRVLAYVFSNNLASYRSFINAGYKLIDERLINSIKSYVFIKEN